MTQLKIEKPNGPTSRIFGGTAHGHIIGTFIYSLLFVRQCITSRIFFAVQIDTVYMHVYICVPLHCA
jgi:hypothetical protein